MHPDLSRPEPDGTPFATREVRAWFEATYPLGPTPAQSLAWPAIAAGEHLLLSSPTGTGKTLAAFLAILDQLIQQFRLGTLPGGVRCVYVAPLRSLNYDIERNLQVPLDGIRERLGVDSSPIRVGVRTGDTGAGDRRRMRERPPHLLITTPESLALLLSQASWRERLQEVRHLIVDEVHALARTKRGADLAVSLERLAAWTNRDPQRIGLSATCAAGDSSPLFLTGPERNCRVLRAPGPGGTAAGSIEVESLIQPGDSGHRGRAEHRLLNFLRRSLATNRTTLIFANTRAMAEKVVHDLRLDACARGEAEPAVAAHHSALEATRRRAIESALKAGELRLVASSTSLELGIDVGAIDVVAQLGLPGGVGRFLQRLGRSGRQRGSRPRGVILAATPGELAGAVVTAEAARQGRIEPVAMIRAPLDVVCQQLVGLACAGDQSIDQTYNLIRRCGPMARLERQDFDRCLAYLAGELSSPPGAYEPESGGLRTSSPRLWKRDGRFGLFTPRVARWFRSNVGTIHAEPTARVVMAGTILGTLESAYAERLVRGDRFVLDGRSLEVTRVVLGTIHARPTTQEAYLPRWTSDRPSLTRELAREVAAFRYEAGRILLEQGFKGLSRWLGARYPCGPGCAELLGELFEGQARASEIPNSHGILVEASPGECGGTILHAFHAPLHRAACEALARACAARYGRLLGRNLSIAVADLGWAIELPVETGIELSDELKRQLLDPQGFRQDVLEGLERGELLAKRFQKIAATALMVLKNPQPGQRVRVGGLNWVAARLYPLIKAACPDHPLILETRREVLEDLLDLPSALAWLESRPCIQVRRLDVPSPFTRAWITPATPEPVAFESTAQALARLHRRLTLAASGAAQ